MPRRPDLPCNRCGALMWRGTGALPEGEARCRACRAIEPQANARRGPTTVLRCAECARDFDATGTQASRRRYCGRICANRAVNRASGAARRIRHLDDPRTTRARREAAAPGLTYTERRHLLATWIRQRRTCMYCSAAATTVDHVLPLVRGGTHYEGNLAPCCKRCNSSKSGHTLIEWRSGRRLPAMSSYAPQVRRTIALAKICAECASEYVAASHRSMYCSARCGERHRRLARRTLTRPCRLCGVETNRPRWCSDTCMLEGNARRARDLYRGRAGLPIDTNRPTSPRRPRLIRTS